MKFKALCLTLSILGTSGCVALLPLVERQSSGEISPLDENVKTSSMLPQTPPESAAEGIKYRTSNLSKQQKIAQLIQLLEHERDVVRTNAATDLGFYGPMASAAVEPLARAVRTDESEWVRRAAVKSLGKIGTEDVIQPLKDALSDQNRFVAHSATNVLRKLSSVSSGKVVLSKQSVSPQAILKNSSASQNRLKALTRESVAKSTLSGRVTSQDSDGQTRTPDAPLRYEAKGSEIRKL